MNRCHAHLLKRNLLSSALALMTTCQVAQAGPVGQWTRLSDTNPRNIHEAGVARTGDGVLHVVWPRTNGTKVDLMHRAIAPDGKERGPANAVVTGWEGVSNPSLIVTPEGGLRVFFGGIRSKEGDETNNSLNTATSGASGAIWQLLTGKAAATADAYTSPIGATLDKNGTPVTTWATTYGVGVHFGVDPTQPDLDDKELNEHPCCGYEPQVATDAGTGEVVVGWFSNATNHEGLWTKTIAPSAQAKRFVPDSAIFYAGQPNKSALSLSQRAALSARLGKPGVWMAYGVGYPTYKSINLWRHGSTQPLVVATQQDGAHHVNIAAAPEGRLWVMWAREGQLFFKRSNLAVSRFGPLVSLALPAKTESLYKLKGEGSRGPLDVLAGIDEQGGEGVPIYHTQVLAPLSLSAKPNTFKAASGGKITFTLTDAGDPVEGATVSAGSQTAKTDARGQAILNFAKGKPRSIGATGQMQGYSRASIQLKAG